MPYRIGIDVGGTFTDFILVRPDGGIALSKSATTPGDQSIGVMNGIRELARTEGLELEEFLSHCEGIVHSTTTADNAMIEMNGALCGLITTEGHRDQIELRRGYKESIWDPAYPAPIPIAQRRRRFGIPERLDFEGKVVIPLDEEAVRRAARRLAKLGVESVAVVLLFSFLNPRHELRVRDILHEELPGVRVSLSHEVMPSAPEFERTSTTLVEAFIGPKLETYLTRLEATLRGHGYPHKLLIMQSNGGIMTTKGLSKRAVATFSSGPTAGVMAACEIAERAARLLEVEQIPQSRQMKSSFVAVDMGGTSYEACLIRDGQPDISSFWNWRYRYIIGLPMVRIHSIGAGGGSIARVLAGVLHVGPDSAGAEPGPICYGRGGREPTVTDANLVLGYLNPDALCGGNFALSTDGLRSAILESIGKPLGLDTVEAAHAIYRIINANMANAIRRVTSQAGVDPRGLTMVVYGGNGPVHACSQALELGIRRVLIPKSSPAFSALGLLLTDFRFDAQRSYIVSAEEAKADEINRRIDELEAEALAEFGEADFARDRVSFYHYAVISYPGQTFDTSVPAVLTGGQMTPADLVQTTKSFHDLHLELHGFSNREEMPVLRAIRVQAIARTDKPDIPVLGKAEHGLNTALKGMRLAYFAGAFVETAIYDGGKLAYGHVFEGPAIVEETYTTIVVHPGQQAQVDRYGNMVVTLP